MTELFSMFFSSSARIVKADNIPKDIYDLNALRDTFLNALSDGDRARFLEICGSGLCEYEKAAEESAFVYEEDEPEEEECECAAEEEVFDPLERERDISEKMLSLFLNRECSGVFRMNGFFGYSYAFARKCRGVADCEIIVSLLRDVKSLNDYLSPSYLSFFPSQISEEEGDEDMDISVEETEEMAFVRSNTPSLLDCREEYTDAVGLTEEILRFMEEDPIFFGNRFVFRSVPSDDDEHGGQIKPCFSTAAYTHTLYALFAAFLESTVSHEISVSVKNTAAFAEIEISTEINGINEYGFLIKDGEGITDLTYLSSLAVHSSSLLSFAEYLSEANSFAPTVNCLPAERVLSVKLRLSGKGAHEGEFRFREPYASLSSVLHEAAQLYRLLDGVPRSFDEKENAQE